MPTKKELEQTISELRRMNDLLTSERTIARDFMCAINLKDSYLDCVSSLGMTEGGIQEKVDKLGEVGIIITGNGIRSRILIIDVAKVKGAMTEFINREPDVDC